MKRPSLLPAVLGLSLTACGAETSERETAQARLHATEASGSVLMSGERVYREVCMDCHATGVADAPKVGEHEDWEPLIEEGQARVTAHGWVGMGAMPPRGGRSDLRLEEFSRAVAWMARSAGADWQDPDDDLLRKIREEKKERIEELKKKEIAEADEASGSVLMSGERVYREVCMDCHATGVADAPKVGEHEDWEPLIEEGQARVTAHGWVGMGAMPPRGGRSDLRLEEFSRAVAWMARSAGADWQDPDDDLLHEIHEEEEERIEDLKKKEAAGAD
ncbi:MAG TPA: c-type cytochrome [Thiobacillaceae bacterium]|nr:c-type cytochrome [Thiobacillaceae bacterium]